MTKNEFIQHIEAPHYVNEEDVVGLQEVLKEFPYCQGAQVLLTKAFHVSENLNFEAQLKKAAAYAADRKQLHALLFESNLVEVPEKYATAPADGLLAEEENEVEKIDFPESVPNEDKNDVLEQQILSSAINSSILLEVPDSIPEELIGGSPEPSPMDVKEEAEPESLQAMSFDEEQSHSFSEWLNFYGDTDGSSNMGESASETSLWESSAAASGSGIATYGSSSELPAKTEFYSAAKMAKLSVQEDDDLVTETLANIYADQGNFEKAIQAFEKLQLKYPEKRVYFAGRIKEIQNSINS